ncbi:hypothetical protein SOVF_192540 [Spinacia oleracea]|nr:hypothetical protein SOVF_192540 [Spinacia oleracea]
MSFAYSTIGIGLALDSILSGNGGRTTLTGIEINLGTSATEKTRRMLRAI